jgi:hypothetical protein
MARLQVSFSEVRPVIEIMRRSTANINTWNFQGGTDDA